MDWAAVTFSVTVGDTPSTCSSAVSVSKSSADKPAFKSLPGAESVIVPVPMAVKESEMVADTAEIVVISAMTAVTPIIMPRIVRKERIRLWQMLLTDMRTLSINIVSPAEKRLKSFFMRRSPPPLRSARRQ